MTFNYYLDPKKSKSGQQTIFLYVRQSGKTLMLNTQVKVKKNEWNISKQEVRSSNIMYDKINKFLKKFKRDTEESVLQIKTQNPRSTFAEIKQKLKNEFNSNDSGTLIDIYDKFIDFQASNVTKSTLTKYKTIKMHLVNFQKKSSYRVELNLATLDGIILNQFVKYLQTVPLSNNTIHKNINILKGFLRWCIRHEFTNNNRFENFQPVQLEDIKHITLTLEELRKIKNAELGLISGQIRDFFLFMCFTGQRISDAMRFDIKDVENGDWHLKQKKGKKLIAIPLIEPALEILSKYNYELPKYAEPVVNRHLKKIGEAAGISNPVEDKSGVEVPKYKLITSHTARRTFVTSAKYKGIDNLVVQSFTGHSSDKTMRTYFVNRKNENRQLIGSIFDEL